MKALQVWGTIHKKKRSALTDLAYQRTIDVTNSDKSIHASVKQDTSLKDGSM